MSVVEMSVPDNKRSRLAAAIMNTLQFAGRITDLLIQEGAPVKVKTTSGIHTLEELNLPVHNFIVTLEDIQNFFSSYVQSGSVAKSATETWETVVMPEFAKKRPINRSIKTPGKEYLRFTLLQQGRGRVAMVIRVTTPPPELDKLGLDQALVTKLKAGVRGLLIITGPTASGKTATALSILEWLNHHSSGHIVTVEDPIEYIMEPVHCAFTQREVGFDVATFGDGLRDALRQAPDCILASEIRDRETAEAAIYGGEAGALMIVTTHGTSIVGTLRKMVALTGDGASTAMRGVLAGSLIGVVRQELVPCKDESGFIMVCDTLRDTDNVRRALERGDWHALEGICNVATPSADFSPLSATVNRLVADRSIGMEQGQAILAAQNRR